MSTASTARARRILYRAISAIVSTVLLGAATGCQTFSYYGQAIHGQCQVLNRCQPIETLLADPATPETLKSRLRLVLELRQFAEQQLQLPVNDHYRSYADLGRPFAVWNVSAAPEFSLDAKTWWYPIVGRLEYRGYFAETRARDYAARLAAEGYDVHVGGVTAYSTLGWFRDPVLNTFISEPDADLAELLFHELAHQRVYVSGDTDFNEAFATAVAGEGVRRWMQSRRDPAAATRHEQATQRMEQFVALVTGARSELETLYASAFTNGSSAKVSRELSPEQTAALRQQKQSVIAGLRHEYQRLRQEWGGYTGYDAWFSHEVNNAKLNTVDTYYHLVPAFRRLLRKHEDRLDDFYEAVKDLGKLDKDERRRRLGAD